MSQIFLSLPLMNRTGSQRCWAPIRPLKPRQRIGYLADVQFIECMVNLPGFRAGHTYKIATGTVKCYRWGKKTSVDGVVEQMEWSSNEMTVFIVDDSGKPRCFMDERTMKPDWHYGGNSPEFGFEVLLKHFMVPCVPSVVDLFPETFKRNQSHLEELQKFIQIKHPSFTFKSYQTADFAAGAIRDGFMLCHETGLGKTLGSYTIPLIKLGWDYTVQGIAPKKPVLIVCISDLTLQTQKEGLKWFSVKTVHIPDANTFRIYSNGGKLINGFYCITYNELTNDPRMIDLCKDSFGAVVVDEGTKFKGELTAIGVGVRRLNPAFRVVVTATPIKNRLRDFFQLAVWASGGKAKSHTGWPFNEDDVDLFEEQFSVMERNQTREMSGGSNCVKATAKVGNLQKLWMHTTPLVVRRRKTEAIPDLVKKIRHEVYVPIGVEQSAVYREHLNAKYLIQEGPRKGRPSGGGKLMKLRQAAVCPESPNLGEGKFRSAYSMTPKVSMALSLIEQIILRNEQVLVGAPFIESLDTMARYLDESGVRYVKLDGRETGFERGNKGEEFKKGNTIPVMLASEACVSYGYNLPKCNNIMTLGIEWAMDIVIQFINRGHRADSTKDVNAYILMTKGTVDTKMFNLFKDKEESSDLVLDAEAGKEESIELTDDDMWQILRDAESDFKREQEKPISEESLMAEWPSLRSRLNKAMSVWMKPDIFFTI